MSVECYRESPGMFDSRTLNRTTLNRWTGRMALEKSYDRAEGEQLWALGHLTRNPPCYDWHRFWYDSIRGISNTVGAVSWELFVRLALLAHRSLGCGFSRLGAPEGPTEGDIMFIPAHNSVRDLSHLTKMPIPLGEHYEFQNPLLLDTCWSQC